MTRKERREKKLSETRDFFNKKSKLNKAIDFNSSLFKKIVFFTFLVILIIFPIFSPYESYNSDSVSLTNPFGLIFFIFTTIQGYIHESGHGVCYILPCPEVITVVMGTIFQIGFFFLFWKIFKNKNQEVLSNIFLFFSGLSIQYTSWYISTAHQGLYLPSHKSFTGIAGKHDFNYILDIFGLVPFDGVVSIVVKLFAYYIMSIAVFRLYNLAFK